jgi:hypothetical protein
MACLDNHQNLKDTRKTIDAATCLRNVDNPKRSKLLWSDTLRKIEASSPNTKVIAVGKHERYAKYLLDIYGSRLVDTIKCRPTRM